MDRNSEVQLEWLRSEWRRFPERRREIEAQAENLKAAASRPPVRRADTADEAEVAPKVWGTAPEHLIRVPTYDEPDPRFDENGEHNW